MGHISFGDTILTLQLTHIELERLSYIGPEEFVQAFAKDNPHLETSFKDMKKTRNLESYVQWFNRLSYFVATEVCKHVKKKQRVKVMEFWIEAARECFNIGNFNSLMAIIAGLNMSPISRLKKTFYARNAFKKRYLALRQKRLVCQQLHI
ncbi:Ras-GEF domain-containing family member 1B [Gryllus bimaculatus]|nr:Ras-GEF domain-containing family member 1B [Gryllus bimaculatus]